MGFFGKATKIASIALMAAGGTVTVGSAVMLGIGTNMTHTMGSYTMGVGSMNYGKQWMDGKYIGRETLKLSYNDWVSKHTEAKKITIDEIKKLEASNPNDPSLADLREQLNAFEKVETAYDLMIAGSVLVSISSVALIVGVVLFTLLTVKNKKENA